MEMCCRIFQLKVKFKIKKKTESSDLATQIEVFYNERDERKEIRKKHEEIWWTERIMKTNRFGTRTRQRRLDFKKAKEKLEERAPEGESVFGRIS